MFLESTMTRKKRRNHSAEFKVKVALAAIKGDHTLAELSTQFDLHQNQIIDWKNQLLEQSVNIFSRPTAQQEPIIRQNFFIYLKNHKLLAIHLSLHALPYTQYYFLEHHQDCH